MTSPDLSSQSATAASRLQRLTEINVRDLIEAFNLQDHWARPFFESLAWLPAQQFSRSLITYDSLLKSEGMHAAGSYMLRTHTKQINVVGVEHVPTEGPILFVSNHPGISDSMALLYSLPRHDLRILASRRDLLESLPETTSYLIYLSEDNRQHFKAMQKAIRHLKEGGAMLTFPAGQIEPDPALFPEEAIASLENWTESLAMFPHLGAKPTIVPVLVSGVFSPRALNNWVAKRRSTRSEQEWLSAFLQVIWFRYRNVSVRVEFGPPITADRLRECENSQALLAHIRQQAIPLIENSQNKGF